MKSKYFIICVLASIMHISGIYAQDTKSLYMPKEIKQAYEKESRSYDGKAGKNYFFNRIDYNIDAEFDPETRKIDGKETIKYYNNSPDSLDRLVFNLYQDIYKKGNMRDWDITGIDIHEGVEITKIAVNGKEIKVNSRQVFNRSSILTVFLKEKIAPGTESKIEIQWNFVLPGTISIRMGTYGDKNFFVAYWFPKVAVYDDISGWNSEGHSGGQEFYNDFGSYDVKITTSGEYNLWSTGILLNPEEVYSTKTLSKIEKSKKTKEIIHIITKEDRENGGILKDSETLIWKFKSEETPDFAFAVSKTYLWDATSTKSGNRIIPVNAVYKPDSKDFHQVAEISRNCIDFFTNEIPRLPYPYPKFTAFNGRGGMEFPGMVNDGDAGSKNGTMYLTAHEMGHSYFPFSTGLNEQKYAWMDEGLITFFPGLFVQKYNEEENYHYFRRNIKGYNRSGGTFNDVPLMISSNNVGRHALRFHAYTRPATAFYLLYEYLGKEKFTEALNEFGSRWKSKHPTPYDFFFTFNDIAGQDLAWFWEPWFFELGSADLAVEIVKAGSKNEIIVNNKTGFPVPVYITFFDKNGKKEIIEFKMDVWKDKEQIRVKTKEIKNFTKVILGNELIPETNPEDNTLVF